MSKCADISGKRFGRLVAMYPKGRNAHRHTFWECRCDCGQMVEVLLNGLSSGTTRSCGCLKAEGNRGTHRMCGTRTYQAWANMLARCRNPKNTAFSDYGGRGIKVCDHWLAFESFLQDMGKCPDGFTIERKDTNGNYEPNNCLWIEREKQARNTRRVIKLTIGGATECLAQWARSYGVNYGTVLSRMKRGVPVGELFK